MEDPITLRTALNALQRKINAIKLSMDQVAKENRELRAIIARQELQIKQMINRDKTRQKIIKNAVETANKTNNNYLEEITELRNK